ncbi:MAG: hypothetical protein JW734_02060 [Candidatus Omnitrophica bacterium]|nr:hypothetical protein [Candidatus Omnitrophota bacterium]
MRKSFTLLEIVTVLIVAGILATAGIAGYRQALDNARQKVCGANLQALEAAVEIYALENDVLPATLTQLSPEQVKKAYAKVINNRDLVTRLCYAFVRMNIPRFAYAAFLSEDNLGRYGPHAEIFRCPADRDGGVSYGINSGFAGQPLPSAAVPGVSFVIVADCENSVFSSEGELEHRHIKNFGATKLALAVSTEGDIQESTQGHSQSGGGGTNTTGMKVCFTDPCSCWPYLPWCRYQRQP